MNSRCIHFVAPLFAAGLLFGCAQQEGEVCERYPATGGSDCGEGLECCGQQNLCNGAGRSRGICAPTGTCGANTPLICTDAGSDAGVDGGEASVDGSVEDAGADDAGFDAGSDAGPTDAGPEDAGAEDAGTDAAASDGG